MAITVRPLSEALGGEVVGVDLSASLDDPTIDAIREAWNEHQVLLFRDQSLTTQQQIAFCAIFGPIQDQVSRFQGEMDAEDSGVIYVSNVREDSILPEGDVWFHSDQCYCETPISGTSLHAIEVPREGGNTRFADTYAAYETLTEDVRARLVGRRAMNVYDYHRNPCQRLTEPGPDAPRWAHPVIRTHPHTGRQSLYVCRLITEYIEGMDRAESDPLLDELFAHMENPAFIYEHRWRVGDVILWDNRCTVHARTTFDPTERRQLRRVAIEGEIPV